MPSRLTESRSLRKLQTTVTRRKALVMHQPKHLCATAPRRGLHAAWLGVAMAGLCAAPALAQQLPAPITGPTTATLSPAANTLAQATTKLQRGDWAGAIEVYRAVLNVGAPEPRAQARFGLAVALSQLGRDAEALNVLEGTLRDGTPLGLAVGLLRARLLLQLADIARYEEGPRAAAQLVRQYDRLPDRPDAARRMRLDALLSPTPARPLVVGVLVPQSGALAPVGLDVLRSLQLGLNELDAQGVVQLVAHDVAQPGGAASAAQAALAEGAELVIGPILADDVRQAAPVTRAANVPMLAFTSDRNSLGQGVYSLNYLPTEQGAAMARHAFANGAKTLSGLVPRGPYGEDVWAGFQETAEALGANVQPPAYFAPQAVDLGASIRELLGTAGGRGLATDISRSALLVPVGPSTLALVTAQLAYHGVATLPLLGTALWQDARTLGADLKALRGNAFATPMADAGFTGNFKDTFETAPHPLAGLGFDAARLLVDLSQRPAPNVPGAANLNEALLRPEGFYSPAGFIRFMSNGMNQRGVAVVRVDDGSFATVQNPLRMAPLPVPAMLQPKGGTSNAWQGF
jgi:branched-chain amino acid transport system substrate-binding protein